MMLFALPALKAEESEYKFNNEDKSLEFQVSPLSGSLNIDGVRFRYYNSDNSALRLNFNMSYNRSSEVEVVEDNDGNSLDLDHSTSAFLFDIRPGYEMHFGGTERLSPYVGAEAMIALQSSSETRQFYDALDDDVNELTISNGQHSVAGFGPNERGFFGFGLNAVAGFDFYLSENLYIGGELNYGLSFRTLFDIDPDGDGDDNLDEEPQGGEFNFQPGARGFRLGYNF